MRRSEHFGRKIPIPSITDIKHELKMMSATDRLVDALHASNCTAEEMSQIIVDIATRYEIAPDRAKLLVDRFGKIQDKAALVPQELAIR